MIIFDKRSSCRIKIKSTNLFTLLEMAANNKKWACCYILLQMCCIKVSTNWLHVVYIVGSHFKIIFIPGVLTDEATLELILPPPPPTFSTNERRGNGTTNQSEARKWRRLTFLLPEHSVTLWTRANMRCKHFY